MDNSRLPVMLTAVVVTTGLTAGIAGLVIGGDGFVVNVLSSVLTASIALLFLSPLFAWLRAAEHYRDKYQRWQNAHFTVRFALDPVRQVVEAHGNEDVTVPDGWSFDSADRHLMKLASYFRARKRGETAQRPMPFRRA